MRLLAGLAGFTQIAGSSAMSPLPLKLTVSAVGFSWVVLVTGAGLDEGAGLVDGAGLVEGAGLLVAGELGLDVALGDGAGLGAFDATGLDEAVGAGAGAVPARLNQAARAESYTDLSVVSFIPAG